MLTLSPLGGGRFSSGAAQTNRNEFIFGGQLLAQALCAAAQTVSGKLPHALHASFEFPASATRPLVYQVCEGRDGRSLSHRRVMARQSGHTVLRAYASFSGPEEGFRHQSGWRSEPPAPDSLSTLGSIAARYETQVSEHGKGRLSTYPQLEIRPIAVKEHLLLQPGKPASRFWMRARGNMPADPTGWTAVLTYLSDYLLVNAALIPHVSEMPDEHLFVASLNHAMWFHVLADPSQWLLYETESDWAGQGRALVHGRFYSENGQLVASVVQETMIRARKNSG
ncbi:acyl-CoA thioesterase [Paraburkholderia sp. GAS32]|uniref:acyl-CoA thioesterase n=1 Tax=Paraburkholderia sp. GAS32 TaxID=3035129 RepID=UPI003D1BF054